MRGHRHDHSEIVLPAGMEIVIPPPASDRPATPEDAAGPETRRQGSDSAETTHPAFVSDPGPVTSGPAA